MCGQQGLQRRLQAEVVVQLCRWSGSPWAGALWERACVQAVPWASLGPLPHLWILREWGGQVGHVS